MGDKVLNKPAVAGPTLTANHPCCYGHSYQSSQRRPDSGNGGSRERPKGQSEAATVRATPNQTKQTILSLPLSPLASCNSPVNLHRRSAAFNALQPLVSACPQTLPHSVHSPLSPTKHQPTDAVATTAARSNPWLELAEAEAAGLALEPSILGGPGSFSLH